MQISLPQAHAFGTRFEVVARNIDSIGWNNSDEKEPHMTLRKYT